MPESTEDTFWGKGFLATSLGTASPDRKKTHKGQRPVMVMMVISAPGERKKSFQHVNLEA